MKIEKLNENKIKITLDINDLKSRNIDVKTLLSNTPESQDLFWDMMQEAEKEFGFNVDESMIYVEAHISATGNFTFIVTKTNGNNPRIQQRVKTTNPNSNYKLKRKDFSDSLDNSLFEFSSLSSFNNFLKLAKIENYKGVTLYSYSNKLYLYVETCIDKTILEYSTRVYEKQLMLARFSEYGKVLYKSNSLEAIITNLKNV